MADLEPTECRHRTRDCHSIAPGVQQCACGQVFMFIRGIGCGRYKKLEDVTEDDRNSFDPNMEAEFLKFCGKSR